MRRHVLSVLGEIGCGRLGIGFLVLELLADSCPVLDRPQTKGAFRDATRTNVQRG
jgi:hypothetical protein